jgi:hypothetical protein
LTIVSTRMSAKVKEEAKLDTEDRAAALDVHGCLRGRGPCNSADRIGQVLQPHPHVLPLSNPIDERLFVLIRQFLPSS